MKNLSIFEPQIEKHYAYKKKHVHLWPIYTMINNVLSISHNTEWKGTYTAARAYLAIQLISGIYVMYVTKCSNLESVHWRTRGKYRLSNSILRVKNMYWFEETDRLECQSQCHSLKKLNESFASQKYTHWIVNLI